MILVELKGADYGKALEQIESTLQQLCKRGGNDILHTQTRSNSPGHDLPQNGGVRAFVILSRGKGVPQRLKKRLSLQKRYGIIIQHSEQRLEADGLDELLTKNR